MRFRISRGLQAAKDIRPQTKKFEESLILVENAEGIKELQKFASDTRLSINSINSAAKAVARQSAAELEKAASGREEAMGIATSKEDAIARGYKRFHRLFITCAAPFGAVVGWAIVNVSHLTEAQPATVSKAGTIAAVSIALSGAFLFAADKLFNALETIKNAKRINNGGEILENED